jgi:hypothetical protein
MLFGEDDKRVWGAFIKSMEFIEILWTRPVKTALYCLPRGFAGGRILISLSQGQCIGSGIEGEKVVERYEFTEILQYQVCYINSF